MRGLALPELWPSWENAPKIALARRKAPWVVLVIGFGGLLACILGAAVRTVGTLDHVRRDEDVSLKAYLERQSALDQIRSQIYLSGTYVRDLLLAPDPTGVEAQSTRLAGLERESKAALETYSHSLEPEEREPFRTLESEIDDYWRNGPRKSAICGAIRFSTMSCRRAARRCCRLRTASRW